MFNRSTILLTISCLVLSLLFMADRRTNVVHAQTCSASTLLFNYSRSRASTVQCQIGYTPDKRYFQCRPYDIVFDENYGKPCQSTSDCLLSFVCSDQAKICVPSRTRKLGEACLASESCVGNFNCWKGVCSTLVSTPSMAGERCNEIDYSANKIFYCSDPSSICVNSTPKNRCVEKVYSGIGGYCGINLTSFKYSMCISGTCDLTKQQCVPFIKEATKGQACDYLSTEGYIQCAANNVCFSGRCYKEVSVGAGETCDQKATDYTYPTCSGSLTCSSMGKCINTRYSPVGGYCAPQNSTDRYICSGASTCFSEKCVPYVYSPIGGKCGFVNSEGEYSCKTDSGSPFCFNSTCVARGKLGESCEYNTDSCLFGLVCRSIGDAPRTCEKPGKKYDKCTSSNQCDSGLSCSYSKCTNLNGKSVGETCSTSNECDSGLCFNRTCSLNYTVTSCASDSECSEYGSFCSCGSGRSASSTGLGTCASLKRCMVFKSMLSTCLYNNERGTVQTTIFDKYSHIHKGCIKEFSQYYSCLRVGFSDAGNVPAMSIIGLDVNAEFSMDPDPVKYYQCNSFSSEDPNVCSRNGDCIADGVCKCYPGYTGSDCQTIITPQISTIQPSGNRGAVSGGNSTHTSKMMWMALIILSLQMVLTAIMFPFY